MDEKQIFKEMVTILKPYVKDLALLENATKETHILDDLKVNSARLVDVIIKCEDVHPEIEAFADKIPHTVMEFPELKIIAKACFGFGDVNSCLVFKKWEG